VPLHVPFDHHTRVIVPVGVGPLPEMLALTWTALLSGTVVTDW
jgi:hypothetical protein